MRYSHNTNERSASEAIRFVAENRGRRSNYVNQHAALTTNCHRTMYEKLTLLNVDDEAEIFLSQFNKHAEVQSRTDQTMTVRMNSPIFWLIASAAYTIIHAFEPDHGDFDAYGVKIAANDIVFVEANNKER